MQRILFPIEVVFMSETLKGIGQYYNAARLFIDANVERGLGDKTAIYYKDQELTYRELQKR